ATSSSSTAAGSGSSRGKGRGARSRSPSRSSAISRRARTARVPGPRRRSPGRHAKPGPGRTSGRTMDRLHVATLNIRNLADRWFERLPLLLNDMSALQPDLLGLQEVVYPMQQDRLIGAAGEGRYSTHRAWAGRPEYGNALLVREPLTASGVDRLQLPHNRSALRAVVWLPNGADVLMI